MFVKVSLLLALSSLPPAQGAGTFYYQVAEYLNGQCPAECPALEQIVTADQWQQCEEKTTTAGFEDCEYRALVTLIGSNETQTCFSNSSTEALVSSVDLAVGQIFSLADLVEGSWVTLKLSQPIKAACEWWIAPSFDFITEPCHVNATEVDLATPASITAPVGATDVRLPLKTLKQTGLVTKVGRDECLNFTTTEYTSVKWEVFSDNYPTSDTSGSASTLTLTLLPAVSLAFLYLF